MTLLAASALVVFAQAGNAVLLIHTTEDGWAAFEQRVAAELQAGGFHVRERKASIDASGDVAAQLFAQCRDEDAIAALWFRPRPDGSVDAWVADKVTSKAVVRTYTQPNSGAERARLALRAVELLHASLLEVRLMEPAEDMPDLPPPRRFAPRPRVPHWTFGTGVGVVFTGLSLRPQPLLELRLGYAFNDWVTLEAHGISSVFPARVEASDFGADVGLALIRALVSFVPPPLRGSTVSLGLVAGTGALMVWTSGEGRITGVELQTEARISWLVSAGIVAAAQVSEGIRIALMVTPGITVPEMAVQLAGTVYTSVGRPLIDVMLRLEFE